MSSTPGGPGAPPDRPLRILWLIKGLGAGGAEQLLVNHARVRDRDRFEYEAAYLVGAKPHHVVTLETLGVPVTALDGAREIDLRWVLRFRRLVVDHEVDVVHTHSPYVAAMVRLATRTLRRSQRPALVYTEHNRWPRHRRATRWANLLTFPLDDVQIAVSADVRSTIPLALRVPVEIITHGVDVAQVRALSGERTAVRRELGIDDDEIVIGTVANFRAEKGYDIWLQAAVLALRDAAPGTRLRFISIGQGPLEHAIRTKVAELDLGTRVQLLGYRADATRIMTGFDIFTLASRHEGLPVALMDALVLGLPIVATDVGGIPEAVDDTVEGRLVRSGDPAALARTYLDVAGDPEARARYARAAAERGGDFDVTAAVDRLERLYRAAARRPRG